MKTCTYCGTSNSDRALKCKQCGRNLTGPVQNSPVREVKTAKTLKEKLLERKRLLIIGILVIALLLIAIFLFFTRDRVNTLPYVKMPVYSKASGVYNEPFTLKIEAGEKDEIRYTLDGSVPTSESTVFEAEKEIPINQNTTVRSIAINPEGTTSNVATAEYKIEPKPAP